MDTRKFTDAILVKLRANGEGLDVGDSEAPLNRSPLFPYAVLYPTLSPEITEDGGTLRDPNAHRILEYQITSVGTTREQAQWCADRMRTALFATPLVVDGSFPWFIEIGALGEIERDDDLEPPLFYASESIAIPSSPAS